MLRCILMLTLGFVAFAATPVDAQLFRRGARRAARAAQQAKSLQNRPNCVNQQNQLAKTKADAASKDEDKSAEAIKLTAEKTAAEKNSKLAKTRKPSAAVPQPTQQRYAAYYDPRTRRTFLRPIPQAATNQTARARSAPVAPQTNAIARQSNPNVNLKPTQTDIARQPQRQPATTPLPTGLVLNAPAQVESGVVYTPATVTPARSAPLTSSPTGTLTSLPNAKPVVAAKPPVGEPTPAANASTDAPKKTFSILELDK